VQNVTATTVITAQRPGEEPFRITVEIGLPYQVGNDPHEWACPVVVEPLYKNLHDAHGGDALQSLCLAISLAIDLLTSFKSDGGKLLSDNGEDFPLEAYCFGAALGSGNAA
jgi:hypothetical protein